MCLAHLTGPQSACTFLHKAPYKAFTKRIYKAPHKAFTKRVIQELPAHIAAKSIKMASTSTVGKGRFRVTYNFPPSFTGEDKAATKNWATQVCSRENDFDVVKQKLTRPRQAPQYHGVVVGLEEVQPGSKKRKWSPGAEVCSFSSLCHELCLVAAL